MDDLKVYGVGRFRDDENPTMAARTVLVMTNRPPTDEELAIIHERLRDLSAARKDGAP